MSETFWDIALKNMSEITYKLLGHPLQNVQPRQQAGVFFAIRTTRRNVALTALFRQYLYSESLPIIRRAYEDWIILSYILNEKGSKRWIEYRTEEHKMDAKVYKSFFKLTNEIATKKVFGKPPRYTLKWLDKPTRNLKPWGGKTLRDMADEVGLVKVHDFAYTYLSYMTHGCYKDFSYLFRQKNNALKANVPEHDPLEETHWGTWIWWFHLRILTLAGREFGYDFEPYSDFLLNLVEEIKGKDALATCIMQREKNQCREKGSGSSIQVFLLC